MSNLFVKSSSGAEVLLKDLGIKIGSNFSQINMADANDPEGGGGQFSDVEIKESKDLNGMVSEYLLVLCLTYPIMTCLINFIQ